MVISATRNFISQFRHYFKFSKEEIEASTISVLAIAFIVSFNEWGYGDKFDFGVGLANFIRAIIIVGMILGLQIIVIKSQALQWGYRAEFKLWWYGVLIGLGLAFLSASFSTSFGKETIIWFLAPGGVFFHHLAAHRLGHFRYGVNLMQTGICCMLGSLSTILLAIIFKLLLYAFPESAFLYKALIVSLWFALFSILPIPPLNGSRVFFWSRVSYPLLLGAFIAGNILLRLDINIFLIILLSFLIGLVPWAINLWWGEKGTI